MLTFNRRSLLLLTASAVFLPQAALAAPMRVTLYKDPQCGCCEGHADYLNKNGFLVDIIPTDELLTMERQAGVPPRLNGCHIIMMDGYVVIGHVPVDAIRKLLAERPKIIGISIPGMPVGLPGMEGKRSAPIAIYEIAPGVAQNRVFMMVP
jgi:hypothetical protein